MSIHVRSRNLIGKLRRGASVFEQYGIGPGKMSRKLALYTTILRKSGFSGTLPVTAILMNRYSDIFKQLIDTGMEIAIHGYTHIDFTRLPQQEQLQQMQKAIQVFRDFHLPVSGFRSPYLRWNSNTIEAAGKAGFSYSSNKALLWNAIESQDLNENQRASYNKVIQFYGARCVDEYLSLPRFIGDILDIPVSLPDDEMLVERLGLKDSKQIERIWSLMLSMSYKRGELFALQLHPERIGLCFQALEGVLESTISMKPGLWVARLCEIADWYKEKRDFGASIQKRSKDEYQIDLSCSKRATILVRKLEVQTDIETWYGCYKTISHRSFVFKNTLRPVIGISENSNQKLLSFLRQEGYIIEISNKSSDYQIYFDGLKDFSLEMELDIIKKIERESVPLIRFWRWPNNTRSALAITGDIDSITLFDFLWRFLHGT